MSAELRKVARATRKAALAREGLDTAIRQAHAAGHSLRAILAREGLDTAIRQAHAAGHSLRAIAKEANLSPEWVRRIASK